MKIIAHHQINIKQNDYKHNDWYISQKYRNLKSEMTGNKISKMSDKQFEDDIKKMQLHLKIVKEEEN